MKGPYDVGFTFGVFDIFHLEHLDHLKQAREACDFLFVGVLSDEVAHRLTGAAPVNPYTERLQIVRSLRPADAVVGQHTLDLRVMWEQLLFDTLVLSTDTVEVEPGLLEAVRVVRLDTLRASSGRLARPRPEQ